jgi:mannose-6-phosphate isomerase-like protein (cupin superfamily)
VTIQNLEAVEPFKTADSSTIRELLNPRNSPLQNQSLAEASLEPGRSTTEHYHPKAEEIYFITAGEALMRIEDVERPVRAGDAIAIPAGQRHKITNTGTGILRLLCCCSPAYSHEDTVLTETIPTI